MIDLDGDRLEEVKTILRRFVPECEVRVFGSRGKRPGAEVFRFGYCPAWTWKTRFQHVREDLKDAFAESDLPVQVDVHDWHALSADFKKMIESKYENIHL